MSIYALYPTFIRPCIFALDAETAHSLTIKLGHLLSKPMLTTLFAQQVEARPLELMGLKFKNPLGLAAGMDKNGEAIDFLGALGFGHLELGTVTPRAQAGNPKPRMFRIKPARGLINRMGFNNKGLDYLVRNLLARRYQGVVGVSIGKNETTPLEQALDDYLICLSKVYNCCDYVAVNISCPNTPGLTALQEAEPMEHLISGIKAERDKLAASTRRYVPLVVKIAPDLTDTQLQALCAICLKHQIDGISCTNTTTKRDLITGMPHAGEWGGLSGEPLRTQSTKVLAAVKAQVGDKIPLIGIGGIDGPIAAREKLNAGAQLLQLYSAFVYQGPQIIQDIVENI
ncbi:MAG: quinone-dependent dihydroorotate dehydrogenase [Candidatus Anaerobiospirillum merdipullorum]|uniref:Dihydroorotate dehydrogenase (quinone) n=1 Tax=Candidatus Anaerobiospirillum merdipullorum TaxID=2838450 RepID=A0A9E2KP28_9GAMM|nr:quinone-dependent dihydroorotate dehydrogenase [Candidatus Anaerobiospirillum merdipullorum]